MRSVLIFTTAGKTFATAKTAGSEAGSACAKHGAEAANIQERRDRADSTLFRGITAGSNEAAFGLSTCRHA